jgi:multiple sugar transport system permease protein
MSRDAHASSSVTKGASSGETGGTPVLLSPPGRRPASRRPLLPRLFDGVLPYLFIAPAALILAVFWVYPLGDAFYLSMHSNAIRGDAGRFVGAANYRTLLAGGEFWRSLRVSLWFLAGTVPATLTLGFCFASLLFNKIRGLGMYRTLYFLPYVTSTVAAAIVWRWIFSQQPSGLANVVLGWLGGAPERWCAEGTGVFVLLAEAVGVHHLPAWAGGPSLALVCVIFFSVWQTMGFDIVVFLAGLSALPREVFEAADIDGATGWRRLWYVTLPLLSPTVFFLSVVSVIRSFQAFNQIYVLTTEERTASTQNLAMLIYNKFMVSGNTGLATASAVLLFVILLALTVFQMRVLGTRAHY